jgi:hypothetical protein
VALPSSTEQFSRMQNGGSMCGPHEGWPHSVTAGTLLPGSYKVTRGQSAPTTVTARDASSARRLLGREAERFGMGTAVVLGQNLTEAAGPVRDGAVADLATGDRQLGNGHREAAGR